MLFNSPSAVTPLARQPLVSLGEANHPDISDTLRYSPSTHYTMRKGVRRMLKGCSLLAVVTALSACESMPIATDSPAQAQIITQPTPTVSQTPRNNKVVIEENQHIDERNTASVSSTSDATVITAPTTTIAPPINQGTPRPLPQLNSDAPTDTNNPLTHTDRTEESNTPRPANPISVPAPVYETTTPSPTPKAPSSSVPTMPAPVITLPTEPDKSAREALLERARQNSSASTNRAAVANNGEDIPAFQQLMKAGVAALQANRLNDAESNFTRAQRIAPRSSAVYFYLSQVALKKNQPRKAEAMARRGLVVTQDAGRRKALWQLILRSGQMQNNTKVIAEAKAALR